MNKSSGRGSFRLSVESNRGEERVVQDWPFVMFPGALYEELLPRLFPWADMTIDEVFYEPFDEAMWDTETRIWDHDPDDDSIYHTESFEDWAKSLPSGLRPYEENGEVARWRLELTLNALTSAERAWCREAMTKASETSAPPSRDRAFPTASAVAFAGSGSVESAAPILISPTLHWWVRCGKGRPSR